MQRTRGIRRKKGQGLTEYAILIATVSLGLILLLGSFRTALGNVYRNSTNTLRNNSTVVLEPVTSGGSGGTGSTGTTGGTGFLAGLAAAAQQAASNLAGQATNAFNQGTNALTNFLQNIIGNNNGGGGIDF
jgi:Flp pilus assembly pilin Flp